VIRSQCFDWDAAIDLIKQCLEIDPTNETIRCNYAMLLVQLGRVQEGLEEIERARTLAPEAALVGGLHGTVLYYARRYDDVVSQMQTTIDVTPFSDLAHLVLGQAYLEKGMLEEALAELRKGRELAEDTGLHCAAVSLLGVVNARLGNRAKARESLISLLERFARRGVSPYWLAILCFDLEEMDNGFQWLEQAFEKRDRWLRYLKVHPLFDRVRSDERFLSILGRMGLGTESAGGRDSS
jgi:tetratricopeptide (TPR) repeat protein